jgi:hypothetical protein
MKATIEQEISNNLDSMQNGGCIANFEENDFNAGNLYGFLYGFKKGVEFAQKWISVDEELPDYEANFLVKIGELVYIEKYKFDIGFSNKVSYWRQIEMK